MTKVTDQKKRRRISPRAVLIAIGLAVIMLALAYGVYADEIDGVNRIRLVIPSDGGEEKITLYEDRGVYYAFLPSYARLDRMRVEYAGGSELTLDGEAYASGSSCGALREDQEYAMRLKNSLGITTADTTLMIKQAHSIPAMSIRLSGGTIDDLSADKSNSLSGSFSLINGDGSADHRGNFKELHGRGNTTWDQPKKSYTLVLREEVSLLGMSKSKKWVLLSNCFDESSLRNKLAYDFALDTGVEYAVSSQYIDLYIDGVYRGLYMLCEKIQVAESNVNITDLEQLTAEVNPYAVSGYPAVEQRADGRLRRGYRMTANPEDITGGYLIQVEHHEERMRKKESVFEADGMGFSLTSPEYATVEQIRYIADFVCGVEDAIGRGDLSGIDVDSFVRYYAVQELFANNDNCSVFFYKDTDAKDGRLHACCIWDFDLSIGNYWLANDVSPTALYRNADNWFDILCGNETFREKLRAYYTDVIRPQAEELIFDRLSQYSERISASFGMDKLRWRDVEGDNDWADRSQIRFDTLDQHAEYIRRYMDERLSFLDAVWTGGEESCTVSFRSYDHGSYVRCYGVKRGEVLDVMPDPSSDMTADYIFTGWYDGTGAEYVPGCAIHESAVYSARWELRDSGAVGKLKEKIGGIMDQIDYDFGLDTAAVIGVFALAVLVSLILSIRQDRSRRRKKREK